jgi:hypothetical protein
VRRRACKPTLAVFFAGRPSNAEMVPEGTTATPECDRPAACFYVHPTGYYSRAGWNDPLCEASERQLQLWMLTTQASAFNEVCTIYAPRYRQVARHAPSSGAPAMWEGDCRPATFPAPRERGSPLPHLRRGLGSPRPTSPAVLGSPHPHLRTPGPGLTPSTSARRLRAPLPHLHRN